MSSRWKSKATDADGVPELPRLKITKNLNLRLVVNYADNASDRE